MQDNFVKIFSDVIEALIGVIFVDGGNFSILS